MAHSSGCPPSFIRALGHDYIGQQYGRLTVLSVSHRKRGQVYVVCKCACGNSKTVRLDHLKCGLIRSCTCLRRETSKQRLTTHGLSKTHKRLEGIWNGIKQRCYNPKCREYRWYGAKGVVMCDEWRESYAAFDTWAYSHGYKEDLTIDRIDPAKNYEPANCRWITRALNSSLKRPGGKQNEYSNKA